MTLPKFLIFRFAPGAAGNFVSSMLQCSPEVAHMSSEEQSNKPNNNWIQYFKKVFHDDLANWTYKEPSSVYNWGTKNIFSQKCLYIPVWNDAVTSAKYTLERFFLFFCFWFNKASHVQMTNPGERADNRAACQPRGILTASSTYLVTNSLLLPIPTLLRLLL